MTKQGSTPAEIDATYYEARPPQMVDARAFPPRESLRGEMGRSELKLDDVTDPDYPWQLMDHDSPGGKKRMEDVKHRKAAAVQGYVLVHSRFWQQALDPRHAPPGKYTNTFTYTVGRSRAQSSSVEAGLEVSLGIAKGIFTGSVKGSLKWTSTTETTFSETRTCTTEESYDGNCWFLYWQTMHEMALYRREIGNPDALVLVQAVVAPSSVVMVDRFDLKKLGAPPPRGQLLGTGAVTLKKGESHNFNGWVFGNTKVSVKNLSDNDDGQLILSWLSLGGRVVIDVGPGAVKQVDKYLPASFKATSSGVTSLEVWTA